MVAAWIKALLFVGGGATAAAGTAYVTGLLDPWLAPPPQTLAALPDEPAPAPEAPPAAAAVPQPEDPQTTDKQDRLPAPTFDLLRVEADGSVVVAGRAAPEVSVEVLTGDRVLAATMATTDGDFVAVLDVPLEPGDYQLSLRATKGEEVALSTETAIVSIPETPDGQVLAIVEEPGKPAEVITAPEAPAAPEEKPADMAAAPAEEKPAETPAAPEEAPAEVAAAPETPAAPEEKPADIAAAPEAPAEAEEKPAEVAAAPETPAAPEEKPADVAAAPEAPAAPEETPADVAAAPAEEKPADGASAPADEAAAPAEEDEPAETEIAALPTEPAAPEPAPSEPAVVRTVTVEAVEIEGDKVFVAGSATPGLAVRIYANALHLGDAKVSPGGRFLVEATRELPVGDYVIRADLLEADGTVIARAAVPFEREPGEAIAAVAPPPPASPQPEPPAAVEEPQEEVAAAPPPAEAPADDAAAPTPEEAPADVAAAPAQPEAPAEGQDVAEAPAEGQDVAAAPAQPETPAAPAEAAEAEEAAPEQPAVVAETPAPAEEQDVEVAAAPPVVAPPAATPPAVVPPVDVPEVTAPKLESARGAVIIRRGDTLWRISRRVYGMGVRYSTIYLANQDQITDPDRIWPGQVFGVPTATAEGEAADMEAIGEQAVSPETESKIIR